MRNITFLILCLAAISDAVLETFNFVLPHQKRECFYEDFQSIEVSETRQIEAFVLSGGAIDVLLTIHGPLKLEETYKGLFEDAIVTERVDGLRETESESQTFTTTFTPATTGIFAICLDNRKSRFTPKVVQLGVSRATQTESITEVAAAAKGAKANDVLNKNEEVEAEKLLASLNALCAIKQGLRKIQLQQARDRHRLDLHSEANESNYKNVALGSVYETMVFVAVAIFQIIFVRRWFSGKSAAPKAAKSWA